MQELEGLHYCFACQQVWQCDSASVKVYGCANGAQAQLQNRTWKFNGSPKWSSPSCKPHSRPQSSCQRGTGYGCLHCSSIWDRSMSPPPLYHLFPPTPVWCEWRQAAGVGEKNWKEDYVWPVTSVVTEIMPVLLIWSSAYFYNIIMIIILGHKNTL